MSTLTIALLAGNVLLFGTLSAAAQSLTPESRPERPYRGLFAGGTDQSQQVLTASGSVATGFDTSALMGAAEAGLAPNTGNLVAPNASIYNQYSGGLSYTAVSERLSFAASTSSTARQYPQLDVSTTLSHSASSGLSLSLGRNKGTVVRGGGGISYQTMRGFLPFPELGDPQLGQLSVVGQDFAGDRTRLYRYSADAGLSRQITSRTSVNVAYSRQDNRDSQGIQDLTLQTGSFRFTRGLTRSLSLRLGYGFTRADYRVGEGTFQFHNLDTGLDYSRDLSITRRTRLSFTSGATAIHQAGSLRYDAIGSATLSREIGRSWRALATYQRNAGFVPAVRQPLFYDGVNASLGGLITRRLSFSSGTGATRGQVGVTGPNVPSSGFNALTGFAGLNTALTRNLSLGVNYTFYRYNFQQGAAADTGLVPQMNRHSVNVTLSAWAPLLQRGRR